MSSRARAEPLIEHRRAGRSFRKPSLVLRGRRREIFGGKQKRDAFFIRYELERRAEMHGYRSFCTSVSVAALMKPKYLLTVLVACMAGSPRAEAMEHEFQVWNAAFTQFSAGEKVKLWFDGHARRRSESTLFIVRPALGYRILDSLTGYAGYAWIPIVPDIGDLQNEHRIWQQMIWAHSTDSGWGFAVRPRLEQRFADWGNDVGHRARLFARADFAPEGTDILLVSWDEAFFQLNDTDWGAVGGFDQNRLFLGVGFPSDSGVRFEAGYLNVILNRSPEMVMVHALSVNAFFSH